MIAPLLPIMTTMNTLNQMNQEEESRRAASQREEKQREEEEYEQQIARQKLYRTSCIQEEYDDYAFCSCAYPYLHPNGYPAADGITVCELLSKHIK